MFAHVLALCFMLKLLKRSHHYAPRLILVWLFSILTNQKIVLFLSRGQDIFEEF